MIERKAYKQFQTEQEALCWVTKYYRAWLNYIQEYKNAKKPDNAAQLLYDYTGGMNIPYNQYLRKMNELKKENVEQYSRDIDIITKEISKFSLLENIVVYRYTSTGFFKTMFLSPKLQVGKTYTDPGFMSTTLVCNLLQAFAAKRKYNCLLKLYLPKGTKGAYVKFDDSLLNEEEFLLPPNTTFRVIRKYFDFKYHRVYECEVLIQ